MKPFGIQPSIQTSYTSDINYNTDDGKSKNVEEAINRTEPFRPDSSRSTPRANALQLSRFTTHIRKMDWERKNTRFYQPVPNNKSLAQDLEQLRNEPMSLRKDHPFFCLKFVSKSEILKNLEALRAKPEYEQMKQEFIHAVKSDDWNGQAILSHNYMSERFPDDEVAPLIENLALLVRQEGGHLSDVELETVSSWLNFKEQFGVQKASLYRSKIAVDPSRIAAIERSPAAIQMAAEFVSATKAGNWSNSSFSTADLTLESGERITRQDIALYARNKNPTEEALPAANFRLAFAWLDTLKNNDLSNIKKESPALYPDIDSERLQTIKPYFVHAPEIQVIGNEILSAIQSGNLNADVFKRTSVRQRLHAKMAEFEKDPADLPTPQEIATVMYKSKKFPPDAYPVAMLWLQLREQYGSKMATPDSGSAATQTVWSQLHSTKGEVKSHALFDKNNQLTQKGDQYLSRVADAHKNTKSYGGYQIDREAIEGRLKKLPPNLRTFVEIDCGDGNHIKNNEDKTYWMAQFSDRDQTPLLGGLKNGTPDLGKEERPATLLFPSRAVAREFDLQFLETKQTPGSLGLTPERNVMEPRRLLGRLGGDKRSALHELGVHPVLSPHPNIANNFINPHDSRAGVADASEHDAAFHTLHASIMPQSTRVAMVRALPNFISKVIKPQGKYQNEASDALRSELGDLAFFAVPNIRDYEEKVVAEYCRKQLSGIAGMDSYDIDENGKVVESSKQVEYSTFYLKMLAGLKKIGLPEPYGVNEKSNLHYKTVFSNEWKHVEKEIVGEVKWRAATMANNGWDTTPAGKKLQDYVFAQYPKPDLDTVIVKVRAKSVPSRQ